MNSNPLLDLVLKLLQPLDGYKTYIGGAGFAAIAIMQFMSGDLIHAGQNLALALTTMGLRHAIDKATPPADAPVSELPFHQQPAPPA